MVGAAENMKTLLSESMEDLKTQLTANKKSVDEVHSNQEREFSR